MDGFEYYWDGPYPYQALNLPPELRLAILEYLEKKELKQLRLVSKAWCESATGNLFDNIYFSSYEKDLEIFNQIGSHPLLRNAVKELVYDTTTFRHPSNYDAYWLRHFKEMCWTARYWRETSFTHPDAAVDTYVKDLDGLYADTHNAANATKMFLSHKDDQFIHDGYHTYLAHAAYEQRSVNGAKHYMDLCIRLPLFSNLRSVVLSSAHWDHDSLEYRGKNIFRMGSPDRGSPLRRTWDPLHLRPNPTDLSQESCWTVCDQFVQLSQALAYSKRHITSFRLGSSEDLAGLSPCVLNVPAIADDAMKAYEELETFEIQINVTNWDGSVVPEPLAAFSNLLSSMHKLQRLFLKFVSYAVEPRSRIDQVFASTTRWEHLRGLKLSGLSFFATDLLQLAWRQPKLRDLIIRNLDLRDGTWAGVIEGLHIKGLAKFRLSGKFTHCGDNADEGTISRRSVLVLNKNPRRIQEYVTCGGQHPLLASNGDANVANQCLLEIFPKDDADVGKVTARKALFEQASKFYGPDHPLATGRSRACGSRGL